MLQNKLEKYKKLLNVQNWQIQLIEEDCLDSQALNNMIYNDYRCVIKINNQLSDTDKELALIHELIHIIHRDELDVMYDNLQDEVAKKMYVRFHERSIEQMAKTIYKLIIVGGV